LHHLPSEYPKPLAQAFAQIVFPLVSDNQLELHLGNFEQYLPIKKIDDPSFSRQDGAGFPSQSDWSTRHNFDDCFGTLRKNFFREILNQRLDQVLLRAFTERQAEPPFSAEQLAPFRRFLDEFLLARGIQPDWSVPDDQQLCLFILQKLCLCMQDPDTALFPYLIEGVPLGIDEEIQPSKCFPMQTSDLPFEPPLLSVHHTNWPLKTSQPLSGISSKKKWMQVGWFHFPGPWKTLKPSLNMDWQSENWAWQ